MKHKKYWILLVVVLLVFTVSADLHTDKSTGFNNGTYDGTFYNSTGNYLQLNQSHASGNYTSQVFTASHLHNITWWSEYGWEITADEDYIVNNISQHGILFKWSLNNDSSIGENNSHVENIIGLSGADGHVQGNAVPIKTGKFKGAYDFSGGWIGTDPYLDATKSTDTTDEFVASVWVNFDTITASASDEDTVIYTNHWFMRAQENDELEIGCVHANGAFGIAVTSTSPLKTGVWHNLVLMHNSTGKCYLYIDGVHIIDLTITGGIGSYADNFNTSIACRGAECMDGKIDEVAVWNRTLNQKEIRELYLRGAGHHNITIQNASTNINAGTTGFVELETNITNNFTYSILFVGNHSYVRNVTFSYSNGSGGGGAPAPDGQFPIVAHLNTSFVSTSSNADVWFTCEDNNNLTLTAKLYVDNKLNATNTSFVNGSSHYLTITNGVNQTNHSINVSCQDGQRINWTSTIGVFFNISTPAGDTTAPTVNIMNGSFTTSSVNVSVWFNATDDLNTSMNCSVFVDTVLNASNASYVNGTVTHLSLTSLINQTNHSINISCTEGFNTGWSSRIGVFINDSTAAGASGGGLSADESNCLLTGKYVNGSDCSIGEIQSELDMIGAILPITLFGIVFIVIGLILLKERRER